MLQILHYDALQDLVAEQRALLWRFRDHVRDKFPEALGKLLLCVDWENRRMATEAHALVRDWKLLDPVSALQLLDNKFCDSRVRQFALDSLNRLSNSRLIDILPQLVQALKSECYHDSALARFLLNRAADARLFIGQRLLWHFQAEIAGEYSPAAVRFQLMTEALLAIVSPDLREEFLNQIEFVRFMSEAARALKKVKKDQRGKRLAELLEGFVLPPQGMNMPTDPSVRVKSLIVAKCKALDSFTVPMWLVFENGCAVGDHIRVIYKEGDDLRQDALTLQMFRLMDRLWKESRMDMHMTLYEVVPTAPESGLIEVVENSRTCAEIQKEKGGAAAVFAQSTIVDWLKTNASNDAHMAAVVRNFMFSCAGYCVATYVLGIGDRHNDNVMISRTGHLFHIDFGHFLGNVLKFGPINRDKAPFCFTPDMAFVMGGRDHEMFKQFVGICCDAYNVLRRHGGLFVLFFAMMLSTGMPQLSCAEDVRYLHRALRLETDSADSAKFFTSLIYRSLESKISQLNFAVHILAHRN